MINQKSVKMSSSLLAGKMEHASSFTSLRRLLLGRMVDGQAG